MVVRHIQTPPFQSIPVVQPRLPAPPSASVGRSCGTSLRPAPPDTFPERQRPLEGPGEVGCFGANTKRWKTMEKL